MECQVPVDRFVDYLRCTTDHTDQVSAEFPKDVGPPDKSGENLHGPMNAVLPPDQMSDNSCIS